MRIVRAMTICFTRTLQVGTVSLLCAAFLSSGCVDRSKDASSAPSQRDVDRLVNGKVISPPTHWQPVGNLPINMIASADGQYALSSDMGYQESLWSIRMADGSGVSHVDFKNDSPRSTSGPSSRSSARTGSRSPGHLTSRPTSNTALPGGEDVEGVTKPGSAKSNGLYYGLAAASDGTVFAAQGNHDSIAVLHIDRAGQLTRVRSIVTGKGDFPAGLSLDSAGHLFVANNTSGGDDPFRSAGSVAIYDSTSGASLARCELPGRYQNTSGYPLGIAAQRDGRKVYVGSERDDAVYAIDSANITQPKLVAFIAVGSHPVGLLLNADDSQLFVANSESDTISVIDTSTNQVTATVLLRPEQARGLRGCTPVGLALSPDGHTLYAALADMNAVATIDLTNKQTPTLSGYLSTGWYPSAVLATADGKRLLVADARGSRSMNPNDHLTPPLVATRPGTTPPTTRSSYILNVVSGDVRVIELPDDVGDVKEATTTVLHQNSLPPPERPAAAQVAAMGLASTNASHQIEHVIYVIKENRTYDQVFGDLRQGNGDPSLTIFGWHTTPNLHGLAQRFVLLDNCYCCGEVSGDGWNWSTQGMADAFVSRNVPYNYSGRGRKFDFEGENNGYITGGVPTTGPDVVPSTNPILLGHNEPIPDVGNNGDHLWDEAKKAGLSYRNYGFYFSLDNAAAGVVGGPDNYPTSPGLRPGGRDLAGVSDLDFRRFDLDYADSDASEKWFAATDDPSFRYKIKQYGQHAAPSRISEWRREFDLMLAKDPAGSSVPALTLLRLSNDHTTGMKAGKHSPASMVADNDYAVGELVERVSHSTIWSHTAIFIIEDDAQSGEDHVDAHRTTALVISPWIKPASVDHHFYNTDSMLRTMELLLGLPPMTQYEAIAAPIDDWNNTSANDAPFNALLPARDLIGQINPTEVELSQNDPRLPLIHDSGEMDFTREDKAPADRLNEIVWKSVRGVESAVPAPVTGRLEQSLPLAKEKDDD